MILYEYPFNERIRTWLRLEHLFARHIEMAARESALDHHFALVTLFEILDVTTRADLKSEIMRDLEKQKQQLEVWRDNPAVSQATLDQTIQQAEVCFSQLKEMTGKAGQPLIDNDWLMGVRSRASIPGGTCEFDLPAYFAWQHLPTEQRQHDLQEWGASLMPLSNSISLLLSLLRSTGQTQRMSAVRGQFQHNLPQGKTYQLLRLRMPDDPTLVPEISANRLIISVRIMQRDAQNRLQASQADTDFSLTLCA